MFGESLNRYPIKGLSPEGLESVRLQVNRGFPLDRAYAITDGSFYFDAKNPVPESKTKFLVLAKYSRLAKLRTRFIEDRSELEVVFDGMTSRFRLDTQDGCEQAAAFVGRYLAAPLPCEPKLVSAPGHQFTDISVRSEALMRSISLINLASVRDLSTWVGTELDPLRFRGNLYIDGAPAWSELEWVNRRLTVGDARLKVVMRIRRCPATSVNPKTSERDVNVRFRYRDT